jgi:hypothetical protein
VNYYTTQQQEYVYNYIVLLHGDGKRMSVISYETVEWCLLQSFSQP